MLHEPCRKGHSLIFLGAPRARRPRFRQVGFYWIARRTRGLGRRPLGKPWWRNCSRSFAAAHAASSPDVRTWIVHAGVWVRNLRRVGVKCFIEGDSRLQGGPLADPEHPTAVRGSLSTRMQVCLVWPFGVGRGSHGGTVRSHGLNLVFPPGPWSRSFVLVRVSS